MVGALKDLSAAADVILQGLVGQEMSFVMAPKYALFDRVSLIRLLWDLKGRCQDSVVSPPLSSAKGGVKRGPGGIAHPDGASPMLFCAGVILLAWREIHGAYPGRATTPPRRQRRPCITSRPDRLGRRRHKTRGPAAARIRLRPGGVRSKS
jgi:hypothetical protein